MNLLPFVRQQIVLMWVPWSSWHWAVRPPMPSSPTSPRSYGSQDPATGYVRGETINDPSAACVAPQRWCGPTMPRRPPRATCSMWMPAANRSGTYPRDDAPGGHVLPGARFVQPSREFSMLGDEPRQRLAAGTDEIYKSQ